MKNSYNVDSVPANGPRLSGSEQNFHKNYQPARWTRKIFQSAKDLESADAYSVRLSRWLGNAGAKPEAPQQEVYMRDNFDELLPSLVTGDFEIRVDYNAANLNKIEASREYILVVPALIIRTIKLADRQQTPETQEVLGTVGDKVSQAGLQVENRQRQ